MKISLLIPFASRDQDRVHVFNWVVSRWARLHPDFELNVGLGDEDNFNRSAARNQAFRQSKGDVLVIADADTACNRLNVIESLFMIEHGTPWVIAHDRYYSLTKEHTKTLTDGRSDVQLVAPQPHEYDWVMRAKSISGVLVMPREAWETVGGYNEEYKKWGYEDNDFALRVDREWGMHERVKGAMQHLWHPRGDADFSHDQIHQNQALYEKTVSG